METQTPQQYENPRHKAKAEFAASHAERIAPELTPIPGAADIEFEPAPKQEPIKAEGAESPAAPEKAKENTGAGSPDEPVIARDDAGKFVAKEPEAPEMVTVKIDGETMQVPKAEVDAAGSVNLYQIEKASEKRLKKINESQAQLTAQNAELARLLAGHRQSQQPAAPVAPQPNQDEAMIRTVNILRSSENEQEVLQAMKSLTAPATIPAQEISKAVTVQLGWQAVNDAEKRFVDRAKDILHEADGSTQNPLTWVYALDKAKQLRQAIIQSGQFPPDPDQFYKDLESDIRKRTGKSAAAPDLSARTEAKAKIAEPKTAAGRVPAPEEPKAKTVEQLIDERRKARGRKPLYVH